MTSPLYSVGQDVAVCVHLTAMVIPATVVTKAWYVDGLKTFDLFTFGSLTYSGWLYECAHENGSPIREKWLRPIDPTTEYLSDSAPQKLEQPCE